MAAAQNNHRCTFCSAENSTVLYATSDIFRNDWELHTCNACEAVFLTPFPTPEQFEQAYGPDYYGEGDKKFNARLEKLLDRFRMGRAKRYARYLKGSGRILDIGCGNGKFLQCVDTLGDYDLNGIEMPGGSADRASQITNLTLKIGELEAGDFEPNSIDGITLHHVFEHLSQPRKYLEIISEIMKPGGVLVMSFPNVDSWQSSFGKGLWFHMDPPRHLFLFRPKAFKRTMAEYGFDVINEKHFNPEYNPFGTQQTLLNKLGIKRDALYESMKNNQEYLHDVPKATQTLQWLFARLSAPLFILTDALAASFKKGGTTEFILRKRG